MLLMKEEKVSFISEFKYLFEYILIIFLFNILASKYIYVWGREMGEDIAVRIIKKIIFFYLNHLI
jgi:hypothetical protein